MKKFLQILTSVFLLTCAQVYAENVEDVFSDIDTSYKYYDELQTLYDKGMIFPDEDGKFNPNRLLNRDEFVGILGEITCTNCITPNTDYYLIEKYAGNPIFYDVSETNKYYYCVENEWSKGNLTGYQMGTICEDGTSSEGKVPFCPNNTIILEEALAIVMRASGILSMYEAELIRQQIYSGEITASLSDDISPLNSDGSVYSFYPDFLKALEYEILEVDKNGNEKRYNIVQKIDNKLNPKKKITKEDFLYIAYAAMKANSCLEVEESNLALNIEIYPISCNANIVSACTPANILPELKVYDFFANVGLLEGDSITRDNQYIWRVYDYYTGTESQFYGKYIDSYSFTLDGKYRVYLRVVTDKGNEAEVYRDLSFDSMSNAECQPGSSINASSLIGTTPSPINFGGIISCSNPDSAYFWNFGDGESGFGKNVEHVYKTPGNYEVGLTIIENKRVVSNGTVTITITEGNGSGDYDNDSVPDINDLCSTIWGVVSNNGCPLYDNICTIDSDCENGYYCLNGACVIKQISNNCYYSGGDMIIGNLACNTCPCEYKVDFLSSIRRCDLVFPAITSPDGATIYSRGDYFELR